MRVDRADYWRHNFHVMGVAMNETVTSTALDADTATTSDLIDWLKDSPFPHDQKAATEIERLRAENAKLRKHAEAMADSGNLIEASLAAERFRAWRAKQ